MRYDLIAGSPVGSPVQLTMPGGPDWAFLPAALPPHYEVPYHLHRVLADARESLGTLNGICQTLDNPRLLLTPLQQREALRSSSMEGTHVHPMELLQYNLNPGEAKHENERRNAWHEVANHQRALTRGIDLLNELPFSNRLIREIHGTLLHNVRGADKMPGTFRPRQVQIGSDARFVPPPPKQVEPLMANLEEYLNTASGVHPLIRAFIAHYQFEAIHPFLDGNGRVGRVLLSLCIGRWLSHEHPWLYMSAYFDEWKDEYVSGLYNVSIRGDWDAWLEFCLRGVVHQSQEAIRTCRSLYALRDDLLRRTSHLSKRMHAIVYDLFTMPVFQVSDLMEMGGSTRPTAQRDANKLVRAGIAKRVESTSVRTYYIPEIFHIAFENESGT